LEYLSVKCRIIHKKDDFNGIEKLVLPGVGAFQAAIEKLNAKGIYEVINDWLISDKPFLGICLGMQVLFEESDESEGVRGFGRFKGRVCRFRTLKVPQIGWNQVKIMKKSKIMKGINDNSFFYFLHGYFVQTQDKKIIVGATEYGLDYVSVIEKNNICAVQFHPEKSSKVGLQLLRNWVQGC
jgi:imidazole glycerol phosphate synthase glutamine amidotransferase subunit